MPAEGSYLNPAEIIRVLQLQPGQRVGDFGCGGAAAFAIPMAKIVGADGTVVLFDVMKTALSAALGAMHSQGLKNGSAVWSNLELYEGARGIGANSFDAGVLVNVLHQSQKIKDMLAEIHRMLKPGAKLLVIDWMPEANLQFAPDMNHRLSPDHVADLAKGLGLLAEPPFAAGPYHWGMIVVKT